MVLKHTTLQMEMSVYKTIKCPNGKDKMMSVWRTNEIVCATATESFVHHENCTYPAIVCLSAIMSNKNASLYLQLHLFFV